MFRTSDIAYAAEIVFCRPLNSCQGYSMGIKRSKAVVVGGGGGGVSKQ